LKILDTMRTQASRPEISAGQTPDTARDSFVTAQDGLRLHVREYGLRTATVLPVVCLPGLARTVADFDVLAPVLANDRGLKRRVIAIDSRGRGQSEYDADPQNYNVATELADAVSVLTALAIGPAVFVGSSRGGILTMLMGATHPTLVAGAVLHDIGPVIEQKGLARIKSYVGKLPQPRNFEEASEILRRLFSVQFPKFTAEQWRAAAHRTWRVKKNELVLTYDVRLARAIASIDIERSLPPLWNEFDALSHVPILVIRGANSDILSAETVAAMKARHPNMASIEVPDQGHVPPLEGDDLISRIVGFVASCDEAARRTANMPRSTAAIELRTLASNRGGDRWR
jgi:pimeloyl-ACP methyl ester carboxylesterase